MSRSSFSIRRLISPRRSQTINERRHSGDSIGSEDLSLFKYRRKQQKSKSWAPTRRPSNPKSRRPSREETLARRTQSIKRIPAESPSCPQGSPNSSSSSLCSCECHTDTASTNTSYGTLCSPRLQERPSRSTAPKRLADRRHLCISPLSPPPSSTLRPKSTEAYNKAHEAGDIDLSEHPALRETMTPPPTPEDNGLDRWSLNVQQLIRETDEAFKAVGTAIEEAKVAVSTFPPHTEAQAHHAPTSLASLKLAKPDSPSLPLLRLQSSNSTPALPPPPSSASVSSASKPRRRTSKKSKRVKMRPRKSSRWQLGEDVADILTGQFFRKVEVDELLTPDRLHALRVERESQSQPRRSTDTLRTISTDGSETPVEPFHLQDLLSRIGAAGAKTTITPSEAMTPPELLDSSVRRDLPFKEKSPRRKTPVTKDEYEADDPTMVAPPPPPAKNPARFLPRPQAPLLATIPEVVVTTPDVGGHSAENSNSTAARTFAPVDEDDFVFLSSTPFTFNHPAFRHGRIRLPKSEVVKGLTIDPDDTLDWTAFQMAILGGAGDLFSDPADFSQRSETEETANLAAWFDGFGFDSHGRLLTSDEPASRLQRSRASTTELSPKSFGRAARDSELPIPVRAEHPTGFWNEGNINASKFLTHGCNIRRWTMEGHPKRHNRESVESLPPSPMMDLVMMRGSDGEPEVVPMGYNLGHDLGDFLRWEAENVYATGAY
ncbi:hypothetical protein CORC01_10943 [Colletotrichum orchidophilum]|uniref:Uncharacterized protein n=1 Tax=Colletotrichum orchidophilum TaxID=1209926 RepID=A0A1G4AX70_9PEZI|nr:uncharacterized protein CORC01_10943 [Colletotrichum orchidophilum]OHE93716.1 hypothetical protein CORC01_10943 [Colletotrichum orchidophilum]